MRSTKSHENSPKNTKNPPSLFRFMAKAKVQAILLDIEGTTTPVAFVYEVLFPYTRNHVREFVQQNHRAGEVQADILALKVEHRSDIEHRNEPPAWLEDSADAEVEAATQYVLWLMDQDRKSKALKSLQGKIWEGGYQRGSLKGDVYPDVVPAFKRWREQQRSIYIFSSGSVLAQKLLFAHTTEGDLTNYISGYFDTTVGAKTDARSYQAIAAETGSPATEILFVSDVIPELDAAGAAGMESALCVRSADSNSTTSMHPIITTFDAIFP
jgi:enolase-phosphatase E1